MNKFDEFDWIKTPDNWQNINFSQKELKKSKNLTYRLVLMGICIIVVISSVGIVYAYNENFRSWVQQQFHIQEVNSVPQMQSTKEWAIEDYFLYYYHEDEGNEIVDEVFVLENGRYIKRDIQKMEGVYEKQDYSFDYVKYKDRIFTFHKKGFFQYGLQLLDGDILYFGSEDNDLCSLDMKSGHIKKITNDQDSVNFSISPEKTYILINKNDKYWTVYNTKTQVEKRLDALNPYAHNNEYSFMNDKELIAFNSYDKTCIINLETFKIKELNTTCLYPEASTFTFSFENNQTTIYNHFNHKQYSIHIDVENYNYVIKQNRYIIFKSFDEKKIIIVDFDSQKFKVMDYLGTNENIDTLLLDEEYLIVYNDIDYYIILLKEIFEDSTA